ncbi:hypothetical protein J1N35_046215 [Gossypium stocksii]|uniref:Uncharacterized protein n=1 Tax=Gossypium stocksii TaxID=47602 RepID=A0A9D3ZEC6_9ROSI|nr:hypothetical protein J1N35_046215 [Gossypium stocksii]
MNDDIEELKKLMNIIISYPFVSDKPDYDRFNLSPELRCFLHYLNSEFFANLGDWVHALYNKRVLYKVYHHSQKSYDFLRAAAVVRFCSNVFWHYNNYAIECWERTIGKIGIVRKLSEALPNLFIVLFDGCINHACNLEDLYQPEMHEAV